MEPFSPLKDDSGITIVLDVTNSMAEVIGDLREMLAQYVIRQVARKEEWRQVERLSLVLFGDHISRSSFFGLESHDRELVRRGHPIREPNEHRPTDAIRFSGTTSNLEEFVYWLTTKAHAMGGGDTPEAIACALLAARKLDPASSIWLVTDAFPHGNPYTTPYFHCRCGVELDLTNVKVIAEDSWDERGGLPPRDLDLELLAEDMKEKESEHEEPVRV